MLDSSSSSYSSFAADFYRQFFFSVETIEIIQKHFTNTKVDCCLLLYTYYYNWPQTPATKNNITIIMIYIIIYILDISLNENQMYVDVSGVMKAEYLYNTRLQ